jgi:crossover junction endodeoxyribonuclease RusA
MIRLTLPWPSSELSQNARLHHSVRARSVKKARSDAYWLTKEANNGSLTGAYSLRVTFVFCPPDKRKRDLDNAFGCLKAARDGIAEALGIDDSRWNEITILRGPVEKPGRVEITLEAV